MRCANKLLDSDDTPIMSIQRAADRFKKVGMIEVKVYNETAGKEGGDTNVKFTGFLKKKVAGVHEKALKGDAKSHGTAYVKFLLHSIKLSCSRESWDSLLIISNTDCLWRRK